MARRRLTDQEQRERLERSLEKRAQDAIRRELMRRVRNAFREIGRAAYLAHLQDQARSAWSRPHSEVCALVREVERVRTLWRNPA